MKKQAGVWIDGEHALCVTLTDQEPVVKEIESPIENRVYHDHEGDQGSFMGTHHLDQQKTWSERKKQQINRYLEAVIAEIKGADELIILGPAELKKHLAKKIENEEPSLFQRVKSVESSEKLTRNQLLARVKDFFSQEV
ncbi:MAG: hypothetical protein AB7K37_06330 [Cyclobacteriaceae bacterium]